MSKDWTPAEHQAASAAMERAGQPSYKQFCDELSRAPKQLVLQLIGRDSWNRPVYEGDGQLYVDVDPRKSSAPKICTKSGNDFDGEPDIPLSDMVEVEFIPYRDTW